MRQVKVILREDIHRLGDAGELVSVKPGYARNYLLPQGKATLATEARIKQLEHERRVINERFASELSNHEALKSRLEATALSFAAQAGEEGKLFGSVTAQQIADQLAEKGLIIDRRKIALDMPIKSLGEHQVSIRLRRELVAVVKVTVESSV